MREFIAGAIVALALVLAAVGTMAAMYATSAPAERPVVRCEEDMPCWDPARMGNHRGTLWGPVYRVQRQNF